MVIWWLNTHTITDCYCSLLVLGCNQYSHSDYWKKFSAANNRYWTIWSYMSLGWRMYIVVPCSFTIFPFSLEPAHSTCIMLCGYQTASFQWYFVYWLIIMMRVSSYWQHLLSLAKLSLLTWRDYVGSYPFSSYRSTQLQNFKSYHIYCTCMGVWGIVRSICSFSVMGWCK